MCSRIEHALSDNPQIIISILPFLKNMNLAKISDESALEPASPPMERLASHESATVPNHELMSECANICNAIAPPIIKFSENCNSCSMKVAEKRPPERERNVNVAA
mmetsp:Transcript_27091/g.54739  ORF Transcript_27091/g.54739 Transcript_27091/m.54739 type:complete len:106 (-) Transcript_27091:193-510(-)